jgi:hypothetical protein
MATTYEIVQGIQQAVANAYDGAPRDDEEKIKIGLKREDGNPTLHSRQGQMDGFGCKISKNVLMITYNTEVLIKDIHDMGGVEKYQDEMGQVMGNIVKYLKKEYKKVTGSSLKLKKVGDIDTLIQPLSKIRNIVQSYCYYRITGLPAEVEPGQVKTTQQYMKSIYTSLKEEKLKKTLKFKPFWR